MLISNLVDIIIKESLFSAQSHYHVSDSFIFFINDSVPVITNIYNVYTRADQDQYHTYQISGFDHEYH